DENVKVKRELLEKKVDETLIAGIPSRTKISKWANPRVARILKLG
ncbi:unnamed protein product, partial [marine sediment metagenome]